MPTPILIDDSTPVDVVFPRAHARGLVQRDYKKFPAEMFDPPAELKLIPRSEWDARIEEQEALGSSLEHIRNQAANGGRMPSLDQKNWGFCWAHSVVHTVMLARATGNQPYVPLSAFSVAATIKKGKNEGGWCGLSAQFVRTRGVASQKVWPQLDADYAKYDKPEVWADAKTNLVTEDWVDLTRQVWDQNMTFDAVATCLLTNVPVALDFNWWAHSVCGIRLVRVEAGSYGIKILNSWGDSWSDAGTGVLRGSRAICDGAVATRVVVAA